MQTGTKYRLLAALGGSPLVPRSLLLFFARRAARNRSRRILEDDRNDSVGAAGSLFPQGASPLYLIDALHGSTTFWDWIGVRGGGLWYNLLWPLAAETALRRVLDNSQLRLVLEIDGRTFEEMAEVSPQSLSLLKEALATGRVEIVNGTYSQPLAMTVGGESWVRQFYYGLAAIREATGAGVESFLAGEPQFFPQLPQLLAGFGFKSAVLRTHWAAFGADPAVDAPLTRWQAPDGSEVLSVPRYSFMGYGDAGGGLAGLSSGGIEGSDFERWDNGRLERFRTESAGRGIASPLIVRHEGQRSVGAEKEAVHRLAEQALAQLRPV